MPNTFTPIYNMTLSEVGSANDTWGTNLNNNFDDTIDPQLYRRVDKKWVNGVTFTTLTFATDHTITTTVTNGFQNLEEGDRILITGADKTASDYGRNRGEFVIQTRDSAVKITCYQIDGSTSAGFIGETAGATVKISLIPAVPERSGSALVSRVHPWVVGEIKMFAGEYTNTNNGVVGLGGDNGTGSIKYNWLYCDGGAVNTYLYRDLHAIISNKFGGTAFSGGTTNKSDATTTFNLPNFNGRIPRGAGTGYEGSGNQGNAPPTTGTSLTVLSVGEYGGKEEDEIATTEIPRHRHTIATQTLDTETDGGGSITVPSTGSTHTHTYEHASLGGGGSTGYGDGYPTNTRVTATTTTTGSSHGHTGGTFANHKHEIDIPEQTTAYAYEESPTAYDFQNPYLTVNFIIAT